MKEWFSTSTLAGVAGLPSSVMGVLKKSQKEAWKSQPRSGRGGGNEYHVSSLPVTTQAALLRADLKAKKASKPAAVIKGPANKTALLESIWANYEKAPQSKKDKAQKSLNALLLKNRLVENGSSKRVASVHVEQEYSINRATIYRWEKLVKPFHQSDWLAVLLSQNNGKKKISECNEEAWEFFKGDYLRLEQPALTACYERLKRAAKEHNWKIPSERTINRWIKNRIPMAVRILSREGEYELMRLYPALERSVEDMHALQWINGDGYMHNVFVKWPDGEVARPKTWLWQDIYSRKILSYRIDTTEHTDQIRLAFGDLVEQYGIPEDVTIDNTRAAANKWMTGGVPNRYRFKIKEDDPLGLFPSLGIKVHWTSVLNGKGHGQAKPIERAFGVGGLGEYLDKHPAFAGAYTGENPMAKPENYGSKAVPLETFVKIMAQEITAWNAKQGRRNKLCAGELSFDEAFNNSYATAPIRKATEEQRRLWLMTAEAITVKKDGTFTLEAGKKLGCGRNRYFSHDLHQLGEDKKKIIIRFDPTDLHDKVHCYTLDNRYVCEAHILNAAGFGDTQAARIQKRERTKWMKANKIMAKAERTMDALDVAAQLPEPQQSDTVENKVTRVSFNTKAVLRQSGKPIKQDDYLVSQSSDALAEIKAEILHGDFGSHDELPIDQTEKYLFWLGLDNKAKEGLEVNEHYKNFYESFPHSSEFEGGKMLAELREQTSAS